MKTIVSIVALSLVLATVGAAETEELPANPNIDMDAYLKASAQAARHRRARRLSEADFIKMSGESGTVVLDARSADKYKLMHIKGAINLPFTDITVASLPRVLPDKTARILIYCNNNFANAEKAFPTKMPTLSLNLSTYIALYAAGYRNIYELAPTIDPSKSKLTFETSEE